MTTLSRRILIQNVMLGALAAETTISSAEPSFPIIDTHQHLWDFKKFTPPWVGSEPVLNHVFAMKEYMTATQGLNVVKTIYMEVDVAEKDQILEAETVEEMCRQGGTPMVGAVIAGRPNSPDFKDYIKRFQNSQYIKGVRQVLQVPTAHKGLCLETEFINSVRLLGDLGMTFDICIRPSELQDGIKLADACKGTRIILDHCGNASARDPHFDQWKDDISAFGQRDNVVCKVSGIIKTIPKGSNPTTELRPIVNHVIKSFGTGKVMFGGDWPVCNLTSSYKGWVTTLTEILEDHPESVRRKLWHDNALDFYRLS